MTEPQTHVLTRAEHQVIAGVCQGIANHLGWDARWVRAGFIVSNALCGAGVLLYVWCWLLCPTESAAHASAERVQAGQATTQERKPSSFLTRARATSSQPHEPMAQLLAVTSRPLLLIIVLTAIALIALLTSAFLGAPLPLPFVIPAVVAAAGVLGSWALLRDRSTIAAISAFVVVSVSIAIAVIVFLLFTDPSTFTTAAAIIIGVACLAAGAVPWIMQLVRRSAERQAAQAAETTRLDVAAHLHDSVLQTLALIQQRSDPDSDVSRLAHQQEQSLREWLFSADQPGGGTLAHQIADAQSQLEAQYAVRFNVVAIGDDEPGEATNVVAAATIEAMRNAAAHAGGTVSVYAEGSSRTYSVSVIDRGPGVDLAAIPEHHFGIRESIIARSERAGGQAMVGPGPGGRGTEVTITVPRHVVAADHKAEDLETQNLGAENLGAENLDAKSGDTEAVSSKP